MRRTWTWTWTVVLLCIGASCDRAKPQPIASSNPPSSAIPRAPADAAAKTAAPSDAPPAPAPKPPDPIASLFRVAYSPSETLPDKMRRRIRAALKDKSRAPIALHHIIDIPLPDGSREVFAIYEYGTYEDCLAKYPNRQIGRENCVGELAQIGDMEKSEAAHELRLKPVRLNRDCLAVGAVHAVFARPVPGTPPDTGGSLSVTSTPFTEAECHIDRYDRVLVADIDGDHALELYVDFTSFHDKIDTIRDIFPSIPQLESSWKRHLYILSGTDISSTELEAAIGGIEGVGELAHEELVALRDVDGDGHLDVVRTELSYCHGTYHHGIGEPCENLETRNRTVHVYDPSNDTYKEGVPLENVVAARAAAAEQAAPKSVEPTEPTAAAPTEPTTAAPTEPAVPTTPTPATTPANAVHATTAQPTTAGSATHP